MFDATLFVAEKSYNLKILLDLAGKESDLFKKIDAQLRSYQTSGVDISRFDSRSLFPNQQSWKEAQQQCWQMVNNPDVLAFYERFRTFVDFLHGKINNQTLLTDLQPNKISFNATGSKDGRLSSKKGFLNIISLPKTERHHIGCEEDFRFVQCDYRSFQPRLAIFLTEDVSFKRRFSEMKDIYGAVDREQQKLSFFRVMFGIEASEQFDLRPIFELRKRIFKEIREKRKILNPFGRPVWYSDEEENVVFRNFITTCEADFVFGTAVKLDQLLTNKRSRIKWILHDAIMFEIHKAETELLKSIKQVMEVDNIFNTQFPIKMQVGKNFGDMKDILS